MGRWSFVGMFSLVSSFAGSAAAQSTVSGFPTETEPAAVPSAPPSAPPVAPPPPVAAPNSGVLTAYRSRELYTRFSFWSGLALMRDGKRVDLGYFGGNADSVFAGSDSALSEIQTYRAMRISGLSLYVVGLGLMVADAMLLASRSDALVERDSRGEVSDVKPLAYGLLLPGFAASLTGAFLMQGANGSLSDAVENYNADLARRLEPRAQLRRSPSPMLRLSGVF